MTTKKLTQAQQQELYGHFQRNKKLKRQARKALSWTLVALITIGIPIVANITQISSITPFWAGFFFEAGVILSVYVLDAISLMITYKQGSAVAAAAVVAVVAAAVAAFAAVAAALALAAVAAVAAGADTDLIERD